MNQMFERHITRSELLHCALCKDAPCTAACEALDPARILCCLWFDDEKTAAVKKPRRKEVGILPDKPEIVVVFSRELTRHNDPRYVIKNAKTNVIIDDAQGVGYRSTSNARNCYKAKLRWTETHR